MDARPVTLPDHLIALERGWLSSNNYLFFDDADPQGVATLVDTGYVSHTVQTLHLVGYLLGQRKLRRIINTHVHSDHIGGNAALRAAHGCAVWIPEGSAPHIADWDETALLLKPAGQSAAPFEFEATLAAGQTFELGGETWQAHQAQGHDDHALFYYAPQSKLLLSGDALWRNGFGVLFSAILGDPEGFAKTRRTLEALGRLEVDIVLPGHGAAFVEFAEALDTAFTRLSRFEESADRLAWHALKVMVMFLLLDRRVLPRAELPQLLQDLSFCADLNRRFLNLDTETLARRIVQELTASGTLVVRDGNLEVRET